MQLQNLYIHMYIHLKKKCHNHSEKYKKEQFNIQLLNNAECKNNSDHRRWRPGRQERLVWWLDVQANSSWTEDMQNRAPSQTRTLAVKSFLKVEKELKHFILIKIIQFNYRPFQCEVKHNQRKGKKKREESLLMTM